MVLTVRDVCEQAIGLVRGKRLILNGDELLLLNELNYEGLANIHAQDEAVVCAMHFARVRDRLQQLYPWTFTRRSRTFGTFNREIPDDCLAVLCLLDSTGKPLDFNPLALNGDIPSDAYEIIYTMKVEEVKKWPPIFCDVFVYSLAVEICPAITGTSEYVQLLETKAQDLINHAYHMGLIKAETRLTLSEELFNRAIGLVRGQRTVKETSETARHHGIENAGFVNDRMTAEYQACVRAADSVRDRLLCGYAWVFARKTETPAQLSESVPGWRYTYALPKDCMKVNAVIGTDRRADWDGEKTCRNISEFSDTVELTDYETAGHELYANRDVVYIRYTSKIEDSSEWNALFTEAFVILLAEEVAMNAASDKNIIAILEQKLTRTIEEAVRCGAIVEETKLPKQRESIRTGTVNRAYLDYSGIPTMPCETRYPYIMRRPCYEGGTGQLCGW